MSEPTLHLFNGTREGYNAFRLKYQSIAKSSSVLCPLGQGLLGFLYSEPEFIAINFPVGIAAGPFVPRPPPDEEPVVAANASALQVSIHNAQLAAWTRRSDKYDLQQSEVNKFKEMLLGALDPTTLQVLEDPITGTQNVTVAQIHAHLLNEFGVLSPTDLATIKARLAAPYQTNIPIKHYTTSHLRVHSTLTANLQPMAELDKVTELVNGVGPCGLFKDSITSWKERNPTAIQQTFPSLANALHAAADNFSTTVTSGSIGYSAAAINTATLGLDPAATALVVAAVIEHMASKSGTSAAVQTRAPGRQRTQAPTSARTPRPPGKRLYLPFDNNQYCWTHGRGHASDACMNRSDNHKPDASLKNTMGGAPA